MNIIELSNIEYKFPILRFGEDLLKELFGL